LVHLSDGEDGFHQVSLAGRNIASGVTTWLSFTNVSAGLLAKSVNSLLEGGDPLCDHQQEEEEDAELVRFEAEEAAGEVALRRILRLYAERRDAVAWKRGTNRLGY
jgi:hypothetical protein